MCAKQIRQVTNFKQMKKDLKKFIEENKEKLDFHEPPNDLFEKIERKLEEEDPVCVEIDSNKGELDLFEPSSKIWDEINEKVNFSKIKRIKYASIISVAACLIIGMWMVLSKGLFLDKSTDISKKDLVDTEFLKNIENAEVYFAQMAKQYSVDKKQFASVHERELNNDISRELNFLDSTYSSMKRDLVNGEYNGELINAMIYNLQLRVDLLRNQTELLKNLKKKKNYEKDIHRI